mmetsp:Transcript_33905/g.89875  ORF Transcript_33905/g.89875 Transcript_33905/m.89875 type:complete len:203 (-) Transcript_33905:1311-1919(-)
MMPSTMAPHASAARKRQRFGPLRHHSHSFLQVRMFSWDQKPGIWRLSSLIDLSVLDSLFSIAARAEPPPSSSSPPEPLRSDSSLLSDIASSTFSSSRLCARMSVAIAPRRLTRYSTNWTFVTSSAPGPPMRSMSSCNTSWEGSFPQHLLISLASSSSWRALSPSRSIWSHSSSKADCRTITLSEKVILRPAGSLCSCPPGER